MIRTATRNLMLMTMGVLLAGSAAVNCAGPKKDQGSDLVGSIGLAVRLSPGVDIATVSYRITGNGITPLTGSIAVSDPGATVSVLVNGIPAGMGYLIELNATSVDGQTTCAGSSTFSVVASQTSSVTVALQCRAAKNTGSVAVGTTINNCPALTSYTAAPLSAAVGGSIALSASAADLDPMTTLTYTWTATAGTFASASSASTSYTCTVGGAQTLTIRVTDGMCSDTATIPVTCVALACGNGVVEPAQGEQCDPPSVANHCSASCQIIPVCGNGVREGSEMCDPPNGTTCDSNCNGIPIVCGNGIVQPGEACEPPNTATCSATCQTVQPPRCGDGVVNQPSEQCEPPNTPTCSATCQTIVVQTACDICENANRAVCAGSAADAPLIGCVSLTGAARAACDAVVSCMRTNRCYDRANASASVCYCGTADDGSCVNSGAGNGPCRAVIEAAATIPGDTDTRPISQRVGDRLVDPTYPVGHATLQISCDNDSCSQQCVF